jgi:N-acetylglucosamine-6-phosphate deacetylase
MDILIKTVVDAGIPFDEAIKMSSETPAKIIGVEDRKGTIEKGKDADIVIYDNFCRLQFVMQRGRVVRNDL